MKATTRPITTLKKLLVPWLRQETLCVQQQLPGCFTSHSFMIEWQRESHLCEIQLMFARRHVGDFETKWKSLYGLTKQYATFLTITPNAIISEANTGHHLIIPNMIYGGASLMMWGGDSRPGRLVKIQGKINVGKYTTKLQENLLERKAYSPERHQPQSQSDTELT